jgi:hypothetical protein
MGQELLTYVDLADRLQISTSAAKVIAKGLPRYCLPDGRTLVLCDLAQLRANEELLPEPTWGNNKGRGRWANRSERGLQSTSRPLPHCRSRWTSSGADMVASLHKQIDELQRQLGMLEEDGWDRVAIVENSMLARFRSVTSRLGVSKQSNERARGGDTGPRTSRWWSPTSA